jgi:hypothetical protein
VKLVVSGPVVDRQAGATKEQHRANPSGESRRDLPILEVHSANISDRRSNQSLMVIDGAPECRGLSHFVLCVGDSLIQIREYPAIGDNGRIACKMREMDGILAWNHSLIPRLRLMLGIEERHFAWGNHDQSLSARIRRELSGKIVPISG